MSVFYFLGYPVACAIALRILRRPLWGALLAFPLAYCKSWSGGGYLPFLTSAPLLVLAAARLQSILEPRGKAGAFPSAVPPRRALIEAAVWCVLLALAHAHVYGWFMFVFGSITLMVIARRFASDGLRDPRAAALSAARLAARMLAAVGPSVVLFLAWYIRKHSGAQATHSQGLVVVDETWQQRVGGALSYLLQTTGNREFLLAAVLVLIGLATFLLAERSEGNRTPGLELAFLLTLLSFLLLPLSVSLHGIAPRSFDIAMWFVPLILYPRVAPHAPVRHVAFVLAFTTFAAVRLEHIARHLSRLRGEFAGLVELSRDCPPGPHELAYVSMDMYSKHWLAPSFHHVAETLAASCRLDTPIYDPTDYTYSINPVRYIKAPPATPTFLHDDPTWYAKAGLWDEYEYVLVHEWKPTAEQLDAANAVATRVRVAGPNNEWAVWRRRDARPPLTR
jgi:hypothetical protein